MQWSSRRLVATGVLSPNPKEEILLGDINGDGKVDYLAVGPQGATNAWFNSGAPSDGAISGKLSPQEKHWERA